MYLRPGDGIGIRVGLRSQILWVRVPPWAPVLQTKKRVGAIHRLALCSDVHLADLVHG